MLPAAHRLRERADFAACVRGRGSARSGSDLLVVHARRTDTRTGKPSRVGFVVSKGVGGAVVRNRVKRRLRAHMAARVGGIPAGTDLVIRANPAAAAADFAELGAALDLGLARALAKVAP